MASALIPALGATYTVTNTLDTGAGSLRAAMQAAMSGCDAAATIEFNIAAGPFVISPSSGLPSIGNCPSGPVSVTLDGTTQPLASTNPDSVGFNANNVIIIDGTSFSSFGCALQTSDFGYGQGALAIRGLQVRNFTYGGFATAICGVVNVKGSEIYQNTYAISANGGSSIGGASPADRNVIRNNSFSGIDAQGTVSIVNNYIGVNNAGTGSAPNGGPGISLFNAPSSTISGNVVSGNGGGPGYPGVSLSNSSGVTISGNVIGADATKSVSMGNGFRGIDAQCAPNLNVQNNLIAGNAYGGMYLTLSDGAQVTGNKIGVAGDGTTPMPNGGDGIVFAYGSFCGGAMAMAKAYVYGGSNNVLVSGNIIAHNSGRGLWLQYAGDATVQANTIKSNLLYGVTVTVGTGNFITGNSIWGNGGKNIDLDFMYGGLPNDAAPDADTGANERQNHPVVLGVVHEVALNQTKVNWELVSAYGASFPVEFFSNTTSGVAAGETYRLSATATTDGTGYYTTVTTIPGLHDNIAMTASDAQGNTSEFSAAVSLTPTPEVVVSPSPPTTLAFPNTVVGASSSAQTVTLSSVGALPYTISAFDSASSCYGGPVCASGSFTCSIGCTTGTPYASGSSCSIDISFTPSVAGPASETFYICDNAAGSPRSVTLGGTAVLPPPPTVSPTSHDFGTFELGTVSPTQTFTFTNPAPVSVDVTSLTASGPFQITANTCGSSVAAGANCTADAKFVPVASGPATGTLAFVASSGTANVALTGNGTPVPPATISPTSHDFGSIVVGNASAIATFTVSNPASTSIPLSSFNVSPPFSLAGTDCPSPLPPASSCTASVKFLPTALGPATGTISASAGFGSVSAALSGNGASSPALVISPASFNFGTVPVGTSSPTHTFVVTNPGATPSSLSLATATAPFSIAGNGCGATLAASASCNIFVRFAPVMSGGVSGTLTLPSSTGNATAGLLGAGSVQAALSMPSGPVEFGTLTLGTPAATQLLTLTNSGNAPLAVQSISVSAPFTLTNGCPAVIDPGTSCVVTVALEPTEVGTFDGTLSVLTNAPGGSRSLAVHAKVQPRPEPIIRVTPTAIGFGARLGLTSSPAQTITVINEGGADATGLVLTIDVPHFRILRTSCPPVLAAQMTCFAEVTFEPMGFGPKRGTLRVTSNAPTAGVGLSGAGCRPPYPRSTGLNCSP